MTPLKSLVKDVLIEPKHGAGFYEKVISVQDLKDWLYVYIKSFCGYAFWFILGGIIGWVLGS